MYQKRRKELAYLSELNDDGNDVETRKMAKMRETTTKVERKLRKCERFAWE